jgi:transposase
METVNGGELNRATAGEPAPPRLKAIDRQQMCLHPVEVDRWVEPDHPVRAIWELVGQRDLGPFYAPIRAIEGVAGREATDPQLLISLWVWAYSEGVSSAREIERLCQYHPAYQWLTGLTGINYHTLSDFRIDHQAALAQLFVEVLAVLERAGLVSLERVMHDGTKVKANAADNSFRRAATLEQHLERARRQVEQLEREAAEPEAEVSGRRQQARQRAAREQQQRVAQALQEFQQIQAHSENPERARASRTDPEARIMQLPKGACGPAYNVQISTDAQQKIIVGVGVSQCSSDAGELEPALDRVAANLGTPAEMVVDAGFTNPASIEALDRRQVDLIGSLPDRQTQVETALKGCGVGEAFFPQAFIYDLSQDCYTCPAGKKLSYRQREKQGASIRYRYRAEKTDCAGCPLKARCCPHTPQGRSLWRVEESAALQAFKQKMATLEAQRIYQQRAGVAEFPNAWIKEKFGLRQFRLRGRLKVGIEVLWACLTYNIQQWIRLLWRPQRPAALAAG